MQTWLFLTCSAAWIITCAWLLMKRDVFWAVVCRMSCEYDMGLHGMDRAVFSQTVCVGKVLRSSSRGRAHWHSCNKSRCQHLKSSSMWQNKERKSLICLSLIKLYVCYKRTEHIMATIMFTIIVRLWLCCHLQFAGSKLALSCYCSSYNYLCSF